MNGNFDTRVTHSLLMVIIVILTREYNVLSSPILITIAYLWAWGSLKFQKLAER